MTTKTIKTVLFASLIAAMILPFSAMNLAEAKSADYTADEVANALEDLEPYVTLNDKQIAKLDISSAKKNGISQESIQIGKEYLRMQNKMIQDAHDDPTKKMKVSDKDKEKFKKFHDKVKTIGLEEKVIKIDYLDFFIQTAHASHGCNYNGPHPAATHTTTGSYASRTAAINALDSGYNQVPDYATLNEPDDFADWVIAYNCFDGVFRDQTIVYESGSVWKHSNHNSPSEPNPEILAYTWPVWWWGWYVEDWHDAN